jgi:hypothetical protein
MALNLSSLKEAWACDRLSEEIALKREVDRILNSGSADNVPKLEHSEP